MVPLGRPSVRCATLGAVSYEHDESQYATLNSCLLRSCHRPAAEALNTGLGMGMAMGVRNSTGQVGVRSVQGVHDAVCGCRSYSLCLDNGGR